MARQSVGRFTRNAALTGVHDEASPGGFYGAEDPLIEMRVLELLATRLCHELSGPVAAINNGIELLGDEDFEPGPPPGPGFIHDAIALVGDSARRARNRLQFYRFAYGFSGLGAITGPAPHVLADGFFAASHIVCDYAESARSMPSDWQKLACNLLPVAADTLPRGGRLALSGGPLTIEAAGETAALSPEVRAALTPATPITEITARTIQPYFASLLARGLGHRLIATTEPGRVRLTAVAADF
jgi:histidine phosphotransferase ChpT